MNLHLARTLKETASYQPSIDPIVDIQDVSVVFRGRGEQVHALDQVSLKVPSGQIVWVSGKTASGKSTLLRTLVGTHLPASGIVRVVGKDMAQLSAGQRNRHVAEHIGMSFQSVGVATNWTILENLVDHAQIIGQANEVTVRRTSCILPLLEIEGEDLQNIPVSTLSGGQQQRVALGALFVTKPELILLDEPTGQLDPRMRAKTFDWMSGIVRKESVTALMISHDEPPKDSFDRHVVMEAGRIVADELVQSPTPASASHIQPARPS